MGQKDGYAVATVDELSLIVDEADHWQDELETTVLPVKPIASKGLRDLLGVPMFNEVSLVKVCVEALARNPERFVSGKVDEWEDLHAGHLRRQRLT